MARSNHDNPATTRPPDPVVWSPPTSVTGELLDQIDTHSSTDARRTDMPEDEDF